MEERSPQGDSGPVRITPAEAFTDEGGEEHGSPWKQYLLPWKSSYISESHRNRTQIKCINVLGIFLRRRSRAFIRLSEASRPAEGKELLL